MEDLEFKVANNILNQVSNNLNPLHCSLQIASYKVMHKVQTKLLRDDTSNIIHVTANSIIHWYAQSANQAAM
jgi:hypothetical protein